MRSLTSMLLLPLAFSCVVSVNAHELRPAYLELKQLDSETFDVLWKVPAKGDLRLGLYVQFSPECSESTARSSYPIENAHIERWRIRCPEGLPGKTIAIDGLATTLTDVLVRLDWTDYPTQIVRLDAGRTSFVVESGPNWRQVIAAYTSLGIEHILLGFDHLLFVLALVFLVPNRWVLIKTITAFTVAHSITLALATLGIVHVPPGPTEAVIALSIVFLAAEIVRASQGAPSITAKYPWIVALIFGLVHGLGFAGALSEIGLPENEIPLALLMFNVGVELGQIAFVFVVLCLLALWRLACARLAWIEPLSRWQACSLCDR